VRELFAKSGIEDLEVAAVAGRQALRSPEDWWTVVLGSGYRWTVEQMDAETAARVRTENLKTLRQNATEFIETNVIYAVAAKR
jgi:hypothetical protein